MRIERMRIWNWIQPIVNSNLVIQDKTWLGGRRHLPDALTKQGVSILIGISNDLEESYKAVMSLLDELIETCKKRQNEKSEALV